MPAVVLVALANDRQDPENDLRNLPGEVKGIRMALKPAGKAGLRNLVLIAAIAIDGFAGGVSAVNWGETDPVEGDTVYLLGYASDRQWSLQSGRITGLTGSRITGLPPLVTDIVTQPGFAGAPAVDRNGQLVGMAASESESDAVLVIPVSFILDFRNEVERMQRRSKK